MSKGILGIILSIIGALAIIINISFFQQTEWYDIVRWISYPVLFIGILLIPQYSKSKSNN